MGNIPVWCGVLGDLESGRFLGRKMKFVNSVGQRETTLEFYSGIFLSSFRVVGRNCEQFQFRGIFLVVIL